MNWLWPVLVVQCMGLWFAGHATAPCVASGGLGRMARTVIWMLGARYRANVPSVPFHISSSRPSLPNGP